LPVRSSEAAAPIMERPAVLNGRVLVLNQSYEPVTVCSPQKAMIMLFLTKAEMVATNDGKVIRTINNAYPLPSVIRLSKYIRVPFKKIVLTRRNILRRDNNQCQYCGSKKNPLTIDHVVPKSRGGEDSWENLVAACVKCNNKKGNQTPEEAGIALIRKPKKPNHILFFRQYVNNVNTNWKPYLFMD
jgi:5-methylcytosine-specific restriction endonuclease McrA